MKETIEGPSGGNRVREASAHGSSEPVPIGETFDAPVPVGIQPVEVAADGRTALVIIDMQYHDASERGFSLAMERLQPGSTAYFTDRLERMVVPSIQTLLQYFRRSEMPVVHVTMGSKFRDYRDLPRRWREYTRYYEQASGVRDLLWTGSPEYAIREELTPREDELVIRKRTWSPFNSTHIDQVLGELGIENLVITGVYTSYCVEDTARDAADRGFGCVIVDEATADYDEESHRATLRAFYLTHGRVAKTAETVLRALEAALPI